MDCERTERRNYGEKDPCGLIRRAIELDVSTDGRSQSIQIRVARSGDAPALVALFEDIGFPTPTDTIASRMDEMSGADEILLVAVRNDLPQGLLTVHLAPVLHRPAPVGRITLLAVAADARGQGIGRALVEAAEHEIAERGCEVIEIISNLRFKDAHGFYVRIGYEMTSYKFKKILRPTSRVSP